MTDSMPLKISLLSWINLHLKYYLFSTYSLSFTLALSGMKCNRPWRMHKHEGAPSYIAKLAGVKISKEPNLTELRSMYQDVWYNYVSTTCTFQPKLENIDCSRKFCSRPSCHRTRLTKPRWALWKYVGLAVDNSTMLLTVDFSVPNWKFDIAYLNSRKLWRK